VAQRGSRWKRVTARIGVLVALGALLGLFLKHVDSIASTLQWMDELGPQGDLLFAGFYLASTVLMVPASILEGGAGFLYGPVWGLPVAVALMTAGSTTSFLLGRTLLRSAVERRIAAEPRFVAIDRAVRVDGRRLVFLLRLSPLLPFNILSFALGATPVRLRDYVVGTALGHLFPVCLFVYTGSTVASALDLVEGPALPMWVNGTVIALTLAATIGVSRFARRALEGALAADSG
jgi:uncharacterized membrane protein YdjX (TVP38/TMEM64 family)